MKSDREKTRGIGAQFHEETSTPRAAWGATPSTGREDAGAA